MKRGMEVQDIKTVHVVYVCGNRSNPPRMQSAGRSRS